LLKFGEFFCFKFANCPWKPKLGPGRGGEDMLEVMLDEQLPCPGEGFSASPFRKFWRGKTHLFSRRYSKASLAFFKTKIIRTENM